MSNGVWPPPWATEDGQRVRYYSGVDLLEALKEYSNKSASYVECTPGLKIASSFEIPRKEVVSKNVGWLTSVSVLNLRKMYITTDTQDRATPEELAVTIDAIWDQVGAFPELCAERVMIPRPTVIEEYLGYANCREEHNLIDGVYDVGFSNDYLVRQFSEYGWARAEAPGVIEFLLPRVANIPLADVLKIRRDYGELFIRFQSELVRFVQHSAAISSESKLVDLLLKIDEEISALRRQFESIDRKKRLEQLGLLYSFGVMSLALFLPQEIFKTLAALLGSATLQGSIRNLRLLEYQRRELQDEPFYIPYKLTELARQFEQ